MMKYFSMFSGIGGFEKGIEQSGVDMTCVGYSEIDKYARSIYEKHYPNHIGYGDATEIKTEELPDFDLLVGGFPCQAFSIAGKRKGFSDTRGTLFFEIARILREKRPRYFLLENVKGLLSHDKGKTFQTILGVLSELGYDVEWEVLNSKNFGVPQNRERIFFKGYSRRECGGEILSQKRESGKIINEMKINRFHKGKCQGESILYDEGLCSTLAADGGNAGNHTYIKVGDGVCLNQINNDKRRSMSERVYSSDGLSKTLTGNGGGNGANTGLYIVGNVSSSGHHGGDILGVEGISKTLCACHYKNPIKILDKNPNENKICKPVLTPDRINKRQNGRRMKENGEPSFTLTATDKHGVYDGYRVRRLTPRECERLQGFPTGWTEYGKDGEVISDTQRYKCLGNAVTVNVIEFLIRQMF